LHPAPRRDDGTAALVAHVEATPVAELRAGLGLLARLPSHAAVAFEVANDRALAHFDEGRMGAISSFLAADPLSGLLAATGCVIASRATLVVVPASIMHQWAAEIRRWAPHLAVDSIFSARCSYRQGIGCVHRRRSCCRHRCRLGTAPQLVASARRWRVVVVPSRRHWRVRRWL